MVSKNKYVVNSSIFEMIPQSMFKEINKVDEKEEENKQMYGSELLLREVTKNHSGFYACIAANKNGGAYVSMYLSVVGKMHISYYIRL